MEIKSGSYGSLSGMRGLLERPLQTGCCWTDSMEKIISGACVRRIAAACFCTEAESLPWKLLSYTLTVGAVVFGPFMLVINPRRACARVTVVNPRRACARGLR